ncbi:acetate--CoA ligase [Catalinimonas niigatensis]|uniref:acetate--CoA ligase n=1 Tax=Catalinimonas niigatensis TaxID=1397264 RepID=UPI002666BAAB|nr:acetate--CoA ligase [Catalinimonas niigatensis]WPP49820.1 acetate--CoA ligase [Catalinimonas niigatensis]
MNTTTTKEKRIIPNLTDYEKSRKAFSWSLVQHELNGLPEGKGFNIAHEAVDRYATSARIAFRWLGRKGEVRDISYQELSRQTNRFANVLQQLGVGKQDSVFLLTGRVPELYIAALGTWKNTSVFCPLFSAFGPEPLLQRLSKGDAKVLVTTERFYQKKIQNLHSQLPGLKYVLLVDAEKDVNAKVLSLARYMEKASDLFTIPPTDPEDRATLHFTSGTTGMPKGAIHVHQAVLTHYITGKYVLDLHPDDIFWCTADPGWVTGTSYGIIAPLTLGVTSIIDEVDFEAERWYGILEKQKVSVWYTAPTAIRMLMRLDIKPREKYDLSHLRLIHSVGEPLNPEAIAWAQKVLGMPIYDNWWQTETGGIMVSNFASLPIKPGSMGRPLPGIEAAIVEKSKQEVKILSDGQVGDLALKPGWPSMFRGYIHEEERYRKCFADGWYITGDLAKQDQDGYFWFVGRADDIIKTSGHMVGPFEVESVLIEHPAVAEAAVIGIPDPMIGEMVRAYVTLKSGVLASEELELEIKGFARQKLGSAVAPKEIEFREHIPHTRSGKIMRRLLKAQALGLPEGDTSTLEKNP